MITRIILREVGLVTKCKGMKKISRYKAMNKLRSYKIESDIMLIYYVESDIMLIGFKIYLSERFQE